MKPYDHGSASACTSVLVVVVGREDADRGTVAGKRDELAAVGLLEHLARQRLRGRSERDLASVQAEHAVERAGVLEVVRRDEERAPLGGERAEQPLEHRLAR